MINFFEELNFLDSESELRKMQIAELTKTVNILSQENNELKKKLYGSSKQIPSLLKAPNEN